MLPPLHVAQALEQNLPRCLPRNPCIRSDLRRSQIPFNFFNLTLDRCRGSRVARCHRRLSHQQLQERPAQFRQCLPRRINHEVFSLRADVRRNHPRDVPFKVAQPRTCIQGQLRDQRGLKLLCLLGLPRQLSRLN